MRNSGFAERLRRLRREEGTGQSEIAERLGVSRSCIANWEAGTRMPDVGMVKKIAGCFDVPYDYLLGIREDDNCDIDISSLNSHGRRLLLQYYNALLNDEKCVKRK